MSITPEKLKAKREEMLNLLRPHQGTEIMQRIQGFVMLKTQKKLAEYLANGASDDDKHALLDELVVILKDGDYSKLPTAATGQAQQPPKEEPKPVTQKTVTPKAVTPEPTPEAETTEAEEDDAEIAALNAQLALAKAKAAAAAKAKAAATATPGITEAQVKAMIDAAFESDEFKTHVSEMVDARLAELFAELATIIKK